MDHVTVGAQALLAAVFGVAAVGKVARAAFHEFVTATGRLLPARWRGWRRLVAGAVLSAEVAIVVAVVVPLSAPVGFGLALALSTVFGVAVAGALRRGDRVPCRCFGATQTPIGPVHLVRNGVLAAVAVAGLAVKVAGPAGELHLAGVVVAASAGLVGAVLLVRIGDLVALFAPITPPPQP